MVILGFAIPSAATCFAIFFGISVAILLAILIAALPSVSRSVAKHARQILARRRRYRRVLADRRMLQRRADAIEGIVIELEPDVAERRGFDEGGDLEGAA